MALTGLTKVQKIGINTTTIPTLGGSENTGVVTATNFIGDGSGLTGVTGSGSGVIVRDGGSLVGTAGSINFGTNLNVSAISAGIVTVTNAASATALTNLSDVTVTSAQNGQILKHNGSVFVNVADTDTTYSQSSVASGSNVNLRLTDSGGTNDDILITAGSNITFSSVTANGFTIASSGGGGGGGLSNVVEDTTPELGGNLDLNNNYITGSGGIHVSGVTTSTSFVGNITGDVTGNADSATNSTHVYVTDNESTDENNLIPFVENAQTSTGNHGLEMDGDFTYNPSTGNLTATKFTGSGVALTGVVTSIVAGTNISLAGGPTGIVTISSSGGGGLSLSNGTNNNVITASSATALNGEGNLTFDGTTLGVTGNQTISTNLVVGSATTISGDGINVTGVVTATTFIGALNGNASGSSGSCTGNAATATALQTARNIGGVSFDGTGNINLPGVNTTGNQDTSGNAGTATTATNVTLGDDSTGSSAKRLLFSSADSGNVTIQVDTSDGATYTPSNGRISAGSFATLSGTSSQFLKADGSVDSNTYLTSGSYLENVSEDSTPDLGGNLNLNSKDITGTGNINITGIVTTTNLHVSVSYTLGAPNSSHFTFTGGEFATATSDPDLYLERGRRYIFVNPVAGSHPFEIVKPTSGDSAAASYSTGVTGNGGSGNVIFDVPIDAPSHLYYHCTNHPAMGGNIYITGREDVNVQLSHRNLVINGGMEIAQRGGSVVTVSDDTNTFRVDRFGFHEKTGGSAQLRQSTDVPAEHGFYNSLYANIVSTDSSLASNEYSKIRYVVEDKDVKHLQWGTANARPLTLSFWVKSNVAGQTLCFNVSNSANNRTFIAEYTLPSGTANSWQKHVIKIPGDTTGTWTHITLQWLLAAGSDFSGGSTGWNSGSKIATNNQYNWMGDANHFYLTGVQLERGNVSTPFEHRHITDEMTLCERYYQNSFMEGNIPGTSTDMGDAVITTSWGDGNAPGPNPFRVAMCKVPTVTLRARGSTTVGEVNHNGSNRTASAQQIGTKGIAYIETGAGASAYAFNAYTFELDAEL